MGAGISRHVDRAPEGDQGRKNAVGAAVRLSERGEHARGEDRRRRQAIIEALAAMLERDLMENPKVEMAMGGES